MKRIAAVMIASLFVLTAFAVLEMPTAMASTPTQNFSFPYSYGQPQVPSDVGAQGIQGPTVPMSDIGPTVPLNEIGAQGHVGPVNVSDPGAFNSEHIVIEFHVRNGTTTSSTPAIHAQTYITNVTTGLTNTSYTNAQGYDNMTTLSGYLIISVTYPSSSIINFTAQVNSVSNTEYTIYIPPSSSSTPTIHNGPTSSLGSVYITSTVANPSFTYFQGDQLIPQTAVQLWNTSSTPVTLLATAIAAVNGTVGFLDLDTAFSYAAQVISNNPLTGWNYYIGNGANTSFTPSSGVKTITMTGNLPNGKWSTTGTVSGTPFIDGYTNWRLNENTTVIGGITYISGSLSMSASYFQLHFVNAIVYYNTSYWLQPNVITFTNTTVVSLSQGYVFQSYSGGSANVFFNNSVFIGSYRSGIPPQGTTLHTYVPLGGYSGYNAPSISLPYPSVRNSIIEFVSMGSVTQSSDTPGLNYSNDILVNDTGYGNAGYFPLASYHDTYINFSGVVHSNSIVFKYTKFINTTGGNYALVTNGISLSNDYLDSNFTPVHADTSGVGIFPFAIRYTNMTHSLISLSEPYLYEPLPEILNSTGDGFLFLVGSHSNISYTEIIHPGGVGLRTWIVLSNASAFIDNYVQAWYSPSQWYNYDYAQGQLNRPSQIGKIYIELTSNGTLSYSKLNNTDVYIGFDGISTKANSNFITHNSFIGIQTSASVVVIRPSPSGQTKGNSNIFSNNTMGPVYQNLTMLDLVNPAEKNLLTHQDGVTYLYTNLPGINWNIEYNTIYGLPTGGDISQIFLGFSTNITHNAFLNNETLGPNRFMVNTPWADDIGMFSSVNFGGTNYYTQNYQPQIVDNFFENLNQYVVPIRIMGQGGLSVFRPVITGNSFFYSPQIISSAYGPVIPVDLTYVNSTYGYLFPYSMVVQNNTQPSIANSQFIFNSTMHAYDGNDNGWDYKYNITPDVANISGTPIISYSNGLVGGPQPNFTWDGYKYTESVEPSYIQVGVNSANAPPVNLQFNGAPNTAYSIAMYDNGQLIDYTNVTSSANGVVTFTYNPATMPLDPVFELTTFHIVTSGSTAVPPEVFLYVLLAGGALLGAGAIIVAAVDRRRYR